MPFSLRLSSDVICSEETPPMGIDAGIIDGRSIVLRECTPHAYLVIRDNISSAIRANIACIFAEPEKKEADKIVGIRISLDNFEYKPPMEISRLFSQPKSPADERLERILRHGGRDTLSGYFEFESDRGSVSFPCDPFTEVIDKSDNSIVWRRK